MSATSNTTDLPLRLHTLQVSSVRSVVTAWALSRLVVAAGLVLGYTWRSGAASDRAFAVWDGRWYLQIAVAGYGRSPHVGAQSPWPFFPLLPALLRVAGAANLPAVAVIVAVNHVLLLIALLGVRRLAERYFGRDVARWSVWAVALFPMSAVFSMLYPSAIFLAASVWAFEFTEQRRWWCAGLAACAATMARPNGVTVAIVLAAMTFTTAPDNRRVRIAVRQAGPSAIGIATWATVCWRLSRNPFVFFSAKSAWHEVTVIGLARRVVGSHHFGSAPTHVLLGMSAAAAIWAVWGALPRSWRILAMVSLTLPLATGLVGVGRYSNECFPVAIAAGALLARCSNRARSTLLAASAAGCFSIAVAMASNRLIP